MRAAANYDRTRTKTAAGNMAPPDGPGRIYVTPAREPPGPSNQTIAPEADVGTLLRSGHCRTDCSSRADASYRDCLTEHGRLLACRSTILRRRNLGS